MKDKDTTRPKYDAEYIYSRILGRLEKYRHPTSNALSGFISAQHSGTCSWKVNNVLLRLVLPLPLYKKLVTVIKFNTLLISWQAAGDYRQTDFPDSVQMRELFSKSGKQLDRRLAKCYANLTTDQSEFRDWLIKAGATTFELFGKLSAAEERIQAERKKSQERLDMACINADELEERATKISAQKVLSPEIKNHVPSTHLPLIQFKSYSDINAGLLEILARLSPGENINKEMTDAAIRAQVELLVAELPPPTLGGTDPFWDRITDPFSTLKTLTEIAQFYTNAVIASESCPTTSETATFLTFYTAVHYLTVKVETDHLAEAKKSGKGGAPLFQNYAIFNPGQYYLAIDRYLICDDQKVLKRMKQTLGYLQEWNGRKNKKSSKDSQLFISFSTEISPENVDTKAEFQFYGKLIAQEGFESALDHRIETGTDVNAKVAQGAKVSDKIKRIAFLITLMDDELPDFFFSPFHQSLHYMNKVAFLNWLYTSSNTFQKHSKGVYGQHKRLKIAQTGSAIEITYFYKHSKSYFNKYQSVQASKALLPSLQKSVTDFIENTDWNTHQIDKIPLHTSEGTSLIHVSHRQEEESHLFRLLDQAAAEPYLQPNKVLYAFSRHLIDLGGHSHSLSYQALFFTQFFKVFSSPKDPFSSPTLNFLETQSSLLHQASLFIEQGLSYFWYLQARKKPLLEACLFFIQLAQRIRLRGHKGEEFMADLERNTLDIWVKNDELSQADLANVHLHRIHGFCSKELRPSLFRRADCNYFKLGLLAAEPGGG